MLNDINVSYGFIGVIVFLVLILIAKLTWKYLEKFVEKAAEESSSRAFKKMEHHLSKELIKFTSKHQKQLDAAHECFARLQRLKAQIDLMVNGDLFYAPEDIESEIKLLWDLRKEFKNHFFENKLVFSSGLKEKVDSLIQEVDKFLKIYLSGIPDLSPEFIGSFTEANGGIYIGGMWSMDAFEEVLRNLEDVANHIEAEFRKLNDEE